MIGFISPFKILDYLDRLNIVKETSSEYHCTCPVCGDGGFKINKSNGKYQAFKCGCDVKDIRESIRPWSEVTENQPQQKVKPNPKKPVSRAAQAEKGTESKISLARLPFLSLDIPQPEPKNIPDWLVKQGVPRFATETRYWYSKTQWVSRFDWKNPDGKASKTIRQGHIKSNGQEKWKKGVKSWSAYRISEAIANCKGKWLLGVEGEGCVETGRGIGIAGITWQGSCWTHGAIASELKKLKEAGSAGLVYLPDNDPAGLKKAADVESAAEQVDFPCIIVSPTDIWEYMPESGDITDWVKAHGHLKPEELINSLEKLSARTQSVKNSQKLTEEPSQNLTARPEELDSLPNWSQSDVANWLAEKYRDKLAWNTELQKWYRYSSVNEGIWSVEPVEFVGRLICDEIDSIAQLIAQYSKKKKKPSYSVSFINGVTGLLKFYLAVRKWDEAIGLLPLQNGILELDTLKLIPHSPEYGLTWCLPYEYNPIATCEPIQEWLLEMCRGDGNLVQLMRAYLRGIVTGRVDWQKFIELIGPGGSGKSTFTRLAYALVGFQNVHTTTLKKLEGGKFECASIAGKKLVIVNDSEKYAGEITKLKNLTGQDTLPYEVKYQQSKGGFTPSAMVIITTNEVIQSSDYTSGLRRRRISIPMVNKIGEANQKNLIEHRDGEMYGEFVPYIPGLLNWVLAMDEKEATNIVKNYETAVPSLAAMKAQTLVETNPIADWLDNRVIYDPLAKTNIGIAKRDKDSHSDNWYLCNDKWLYANYAEYCHDTGSNVISLRRFVNLLSDLVNNQLGLDISKGRDRYGSYIQGLKIRTEVDEEPPLITGNNSVINTRSSPPPESGNTNVITKLWNLVMDKVIEMMDGVMDQTHDNQGCDGCDGISDNFFSLDNGQTNRISINADNQLQNHCSEDFWHSPSSNETQTHRQKDVSDGDNCPSPDNLEAAWDEVIAKIDREFARLGWDVARAKTYLRNTYGVKSRHVMSDVQIIEFLNYLSAQPTPQV